MDNLFDTYGQRNEKMDCSSRYLVGNHTQNLKYSSSVRQHWDSFDILISLYRRCNLDLQHTKVHRSNHHLLRKWFVLHKDK